MSNPGGKPPNLRHRARRATVQALYQWQLTGQPPEDILQQITEDGGPGRLDKKLFAELAPGVAQNVERIDAAIAPHLDRKVSEVDPVERAILRLGTYELLFKLEVPLRVVINEGVELAKTFGAETSHKYINGVLDKVARAHRPEAGTAARPRQA